ncbi:MAG: hypothetical protein RLZZ408_1716 [Verrucomicrobiota bacterium]|jgi:hypothetical protein
MNNRPGTPLLPLILVGLCFAALVAGKAVAEDQPVAGAVKNRAPILPSESRRIALETAGAFVNDGFRIRDGEWNGTLAKGTPRFLQVTLFAGENYWFVAASPARGAMLRVTVYDAAGKALKGEQWKGESGNGGGARSAAGVAPEKSGKYFVGVELLEQADPAPAEFSLVYAYK